MRVRRGGQINPSKSKLKQAKKLGFPWIPLAESGLFNGLQRIQIKKSFPRDVQTFRNSFSARPRRTRRGAGEQKHFSMTSAHSKGNVAWIFCGRRLNSPRRALSGA